MQEEGEESTPEEGGEEGGEESTPEEGGGEEQ